MPWQTVPSLLIIVGAFNVAAGLVLGVDYLQYGKVCRCRQIGCRMCYYCLQTPMHLVFDLVMVLVEPPRCWLYSKGIVSVFQSFPCWVGKVIIEWLYDGGHIKFDFPSIPSPVSFPVDFTLTCYFALSLSLIDLHLRLHVGIISWMKTLYSPTSTSLPWLPRAKRREIGHTQWTWAMSNRDNRIQELAKNKWFRGSFYRGDS